MSWTLCTSGAAIYKAGTNANSTVVASGSILQEWSDEVEGSIDTLTRKDWVASFASVAANFKPILTDLASDMIATKIINYDMSGYTSRTEVQTMLDVLHDNIIRNLNELKKQEIQENM